jgi:hypothetical protein
MIRQTEYVITNYTEVLRFLKNNYPLYHLSNVFLRDVQFGLIKFFESKHQKLLPRFSERVARGFIEHLKKEKIFIQLDNFTWTLHYPEFRATRAVKEPVVPVKPAVASAAQAS